MNLKPVLMNGQNLNINYFWWLRLKSYKKSNINTYLPK